MRCLAAFLDFCYLVRRNAICIDTLDKIQEAIDRFHHYREVFVRTGVEVDGISLPPQHALKKYWRAIMLFGSPNGLCSSITESKHIKAVKKPWRRSSRYRALYQMLLTNLRIDKLEATQAIFAEKGMLQSSATTYMAMMLRGEHPCLPTIIDNGDQDDHGAVIGPKVLSFIELAATSGALSLC